ncbi:MAG TPA: asparagine synthase (glutamine-hydrolyzing) [Acidimicrobiales bacterium]|nr:asparagine synthase (glutamine-hydrolyzing) [Acidimicrobiales bacterium]
MCGIAGVLEYGRNEGTVTAGLLDAMARALAHRGPDGEGFHLSPDRRLGLAHRRLAIVDPSGGAQPMFGEGGTCLVFNGEIYNYPQLRDQLVGAGARFRTTCDTEVILHLYARHQDACLQYLNGMFAFALWDPARQRLLLARDRLGEKPLYWTEASGRLIFGSEIKAVLEHPSVQPAVNEGAVPGYLANLVVPAPHTLYRGIYKLPPATMATCDRRGVRVTRYWSLFGTRRWSPSPPAEAAATVRSLLHRSVRERLMSDVPVGVLLSGGLDSTTLLALLHEDGRPLPTFSVGFSDGDGIDERAEARWVAEHYGSDHHEVSVSESEALRFLPRLIHHQDEPLADPVCIPLHFVCELARRNGVKVVLAGEGADETFWGYSRYRRILGRWRWMRAVLALPGPLRGLVPRVLPPGRHPHLRDLLDGLAAGRPLPMHYPLGLSGWHRRLVLASPAGDTGWPGSGRSDDEDPLEALAFDTQEYEFGTRLPELLLMRIDRLSMANGVEARVPFLDPALVEYAYRLPLSHKIDAGETKIVLKRAVCDIVPPRVRERPKQGFGAPISAWFGTRLGVVLERMLADEGVARYFDAGGIRRALAAHRSGTHRNEFVLWPILNFALWHRHWVAGESLEPVLDGLAGVGAR